MSEPFADQSWPFILDAGAIRGRVLRLSSSLEVILAGHDYPTEVAERVAETLTLAALLAGSIKYDGVFTLQIQGDGAIPLIVADVTSAGDLRAHARYDEARLAEARTADGPPVPRFLGKGVLAFTVDQGPDTERYQGIVALEGDSLTDCVENYFRLSEQLDSAVRLALRTGGDGRSWLAGAIMIQRMPLGANSPIVTAAEADEWWNRANILFASVQDRELLDEGLEPAKLAYRLYHGDGLAMHPPRRLQARCRCSIERVEGTLRSFPRAEVEEMADERGQIVVTCEFCKSRYEFDPEALERLYAPGKG